MKSEFINLANEPLGPENGEYYKCIDDCDAYSICDLSGNTVREGNLELGNNIIQISDLASGLYTVSIVCGVMKYTYKIVKL